VNDSGNLDKELLFDNNFAPLAMAHAMEGQQSDFS
jgi:hypothetical protein